MIRNYLLVAWRNIQRNKTNSFINIAGLAIGMACVIFISLYVQDELSFDKFLSNSGRIYQVNLEAVMDGDASYNSNTPPPVGEALKKAFPEIESYTRFYSYGMGNVILSHGGNSKTQNHFTEKKLLAVDSNFLSVFNYPVKEGDAATCLQKINSIVLTETAAKKYFGNKPALGQNLVLDEYKQPFTVTAILKDIPSQSTIQFDLLIPVAACPSVQYFSWSWVWRLMNTYVLLGKQVAGNAKSIEGLEKKFPQMVKVQAATAFRRVGKPFDEFIKKGGKYDFHLQPLTDVHLHSGNINSPFLTTLSDIKYVYIFSVIALFVILLACVNFMNLSTAQSGTRAKEVGIRKVLGSERKQLIWQFLTEAILYSLISTFMALLLVAFFLPLFNSVSGKMLEFGSIFYSETWLLIVGLIVATALLAGTYPAFYLTSFNPVAVLKGGVFKKSVSNLLIRNGLVVLQFTVSIALIICTIILFQQLRYTQAKDLGLKKENVIIIANGEKMGNPAEETFRQQLSAVPGVLHASISTSIPTQIPFGDSYSPLPEGAAEPLVKEISISSFMVDEEFIPALQMQILKGRNFSKDFNDSSSIILNETAAKQIGWKEPLGKFISYPGGGDRRFKVIGILKDFNTETLQYQVSPFGLFHYSSKTYTTPSSYVLASVNSKDIQATLNELETKWKAFAPAVPFEFSFLDKRFEALYSNEQRMGRVFGIFTTLSILVACLGLFGLSVYTAGRRKKEIGVRKVLGASVQSVVGLLSKDFVKLVLVAAVIAIPIAWWAMDKWLEHFAYRIQMQWWVFVLATWLGLLIALATISFQAIRAAITNPAESLRTE